MAFLASAWKFHGSLPLNGESLECRRLIGLKAPS